MTISAKSIAFARASRRRDDTVWVLWGSHPSYSNGTPIKLIDGSISNCRREEKFRRTDPRWRLEIVRQFTRPDALDNGEEPERWDGLS